MRVILEKEAYEIFQRDAKAKGLTTRELAKSILTEYVGKK